MNFNRKAKLDGLKYHAMYNQSMINMMGIELHGDRWEHKFKRKLDEIFSEEPSTTVGASSSSQDPPAAASPEMMALLQSILARFGSTRQRYVRTPLALGTYLFRCSLWSVM